MSLSPRVRARGRAVTKDPAGWHLDLGLPASGAVRNQACGLSPAVHGFDGSLSRRSQSAAGHGHGGGRGVSPPTLGGFVWRTAVVWTCGDCESLTASAHSTQRTSPSAGTEGGWAGSSAPGCCCDLWGPAWDSGPLLLALSPRAERDPPTRARPGCPVQFVGLPRSAPQRHGHRKTCRSPGPDTAPFALNVTCTSAVAARPEAAQRPPASDRSDLLRRPGFACAAGDGPSRSAWASDRASAKASSPVLTAPGEAGSAVVASLFTLRPDPFSFRRPPSPGRPFGPLHLEGDLRPLASSRRLPLPEGLSSFSPSGRRLRTWPSRGAPGILSLTFCLLRFSVGPVGVCLSRWL